MKKRRANSYVTLEQLLQIKPPEADIEVDGLKFRVRAMTSGQVHRILGATRDPSAPRMSPRRRNNRMIR
jgi:hypothetical protein